MLVLSRKQDEVIYIDGQRIKIVIVDIRGDKVRLGFEASPDIAIVRGELLNPDGTPKDDRGRPKSLRK